MYKYTVASTFLKFLIRPQATRVTCNTYTIAPSLNNQICTDFVKKLNLKTDRNGSGLSCPD